MSGVTNVSVEDPRFIAAIDLTRRTGAKGFQIRYSDDEQPVVWIAVADYRKGHEAAAALDPLQAVLRLVETLLDGGLCVHCKRRSAVSHDWNRELPLAEHICWYVYDPELQTFRRSCEGEAKVERNDPCPCGSGKKFKRCHGAR